MHDDKCLPFLFFRKNSNPELPEKLFYTPYSELTDAEKASLENIKLTPSPRRSNSDPLPKNELPHEPSEKCCKCTIG